MTGCQETISTGSPEQVWLEEQEMFFARYPEFLKDSLPNKMLLFMLNEKVKKLAETNANFQKSGSEILDMALDEMFQMSHADITEYWRFVRGSVHA